VNALKEKLGQRARGGPGARRPANPEAYQAYLEGRYHMAEVTAAGMARSLECYERSIRLDPSYAAPQAALGERVWYQATFMGARSRDVIPAGLAALNTALELDPEAAEAYSFRGCIHGWYEWNWSAASDDLARAIELNPAFALGHTIRSLYLVTRRRNEEALTEIRRALELDPVNIETRSYEPWVLWMAGAKALAVDRARALIGLFGGSWISWYFIALTLTLHGLHEEAAPALQKGLELYPGNVTLLACLALLRARQGRPADAGRIRAELDELAVRQYVPFFPRAQASAGCGDMERYYQLMNQAVDERELLAPGWLTSMRRDFQADPRYQALLRRVNLD
jgi:tetratricopeptide (TPR) repeat protein